MTYRFSLFYFFYDYDGNKYNLFQDAVVKGGIEHFYLTYDRGLVIIDLTMAFDM